MNMLKKSLILLIALFLLPLVGGLAKAETVDVDGAPLTGHGIFAAKDCPEELLKALEQGGLGEYTCYRGAVYRFPVELDGAGEPVVVDDPNAVTAMALMAIEKKGERVLVFLRQGQYGLWATENLGAKALLPGREFTIGINTVRKAANASSWELSEWLDDDHIPGLQFTIVYPIPEGGTESYGFWDDGGIAVIRSYERVDSEGKGVVILSDRGYRVMALPETNLYEMFYTVDEYSSSNGLYVPNAPMWPSSMRDVSKEDALQMAGESLAPSIKKDIAIVNYSTPRLRERPSADSTFLGWLSLGMPLEVLGQGPDETGDKLAWYHVRVGRETAWTIAVDSDYQKQDKNAALCSIPVLVARATGGLALMESPDSDSSILKDLPQGALMHVLTRRDDGWLNVMVPQNELNWFVDMEGISGYVRRKDVIIGFDEVYPAYAPIWPSYMEDITAYPTSEGEARRIADASWTTFEGKNFAFSSGARLRARPTTESQSFGMISAGVPMEVLGETPNEDTKLSSLGNWYQVRVGQQAGWMYGTYVEFPQEGSKDSAGWHSPVPVARATGSLPLLESPDLDSSTLKELSQDAMMHVLGEQDDGWLYVTVPRNEIGWAVDMEGLCGYVQKEGVTVGKSIIAPALDVAALEALKAEALRKAEAARRQYSGVNLLICDGDLRLRLLPTTAVDTIQGLISPGTLMEVLLNFTNPLNPSDRWSLVRIGRQTGWVSSSFASPSTDDEPFSKILWEDAAPTARTEQVRLLRESPNGNAEILAELPKGARMHVLLRKTDGWLCVMVPRGRISWTMDRGGTVGYIHEDEVSISSYRPKDEGKMYRKISEKAWMQFGETDIVGSYGAELRDQPDACGKSLGAVHPGALLHVIRKSGTIDTPWYFVRIGQEEGWVPGATVKMPTEFDFGAMLLYADKKMARAAQTIPLLEGPKEKAKSVAELPKDTKLQICLERPDGWLYVMVSQETTGTTMDADGTFGYIRAEDATLDPSPSPGR